MEDAALLKQTAEKPAEPANITKKFRLGYLSGAPRVSIRKDAESGGPRAHILGVTSAFRDLGWDLQTFIVGDRVPRKFAKRSEHLIRGKWWNALAADFGRMAIGLRNSRVAWRELGGQVDWVYERFASFQSLGRPFQRRGAAWILETNGLFFNEARSVRKTMVLGSLARRIELAAYRDCDVLVCISKNLKELILAASSIPEKKILVVPNGVDTSFFNPTHYVPRRIFPGFTVGFAGRLIAWQGLDLLLSTVRELRTEEKADINLVIVGDGAMKHSWMTLTKDLSLSENVHFAGQVTRDEIPEYLAGFDFGYSGQVSLKNASMYHSPLKIYEYMAMAKPVLASSFDDSCSVIRDKSTGFLFHPGDKEDLTRALREAYNARAHVTAMGRQARNEVVEHHSWRARVIGMIEAINNILEDRQ